MAIFYEATNGTAARWGATEADAVAALDGGAIVGECVGASVVRVDVDEIEMRQAACAWYNFCEKKREIAKAREAKKSAGEKAAVAAKVWAKRRANGTDKRKSE